MLHKAQEPLKLVNKAHHVPVPRHDQVAELLQKGPVLFQETDNVIQCDRCLHYLFRGVIDAMYGHPDYFPDLLCGIDAYIRELGYLVCHNRESPAPFPGPGRLNGCVQ